MTTCLVSCLVRPFGLGPASVGEPAGEADPDAFALGQEVDDEEVVWDCLVSFLLGVGGFVEDWAIDSEPTARARPKSQIFKEQSSLRRMLAGWGGRREASRGGEGVG